MPTGVHMRGSRDVMSARMRGNSYAKGVTQTPRHIDRRAAACVGIPLAWLDTYRLHRRKGFSKPEALAACEVAHGDRA